METVPKKENVNNNDVQEDYLTDPITKSIENYSYDHNTGLVKISIPDSRFPDEDYDKDIEELKKLIAMNDNDNHLEKINEIRDFLWANTFLSPGWESDVRSSVETIVAYEREKKEYEKRRKELIELFNSH